MTMIRKTFAIPAKQKMRLEKHPDINWPAVIAEAVEKRIEDLERFGRWQA